MAIYNGVPVFGAQYNVNYHEWQTICDVTVTDETSGTSGIHIDPNCACADMTEFRVNVVLPVTDTYENTTIRVYGLIFSEGAPITPTLLLTQVTTPTAGEYILSSIVNKAKIDDINIFYSVTSNAYRNNGNISKTAAYNTVCVASNELEEFVKIVVEVTNSSTMTFTTGTRIIIEGRK